MADFNDRVVIKRNGQETVRLSADVEETFQFTVPLPGATPQTIITNTAVGAFGGNGVTGRITLASATGATHARLDARDAQLALGGKEADGGKGRGGDIRLFDNEGNTTLRLTGSDGKIRIHDWTISVPDHVFDASYRLRPLTELAAYIEEARHLPGVPSAAAIAEQGVDVTGLLMTLLEKVEELTLYTIAQQRALDELRAQTRV